MLDEAVLRSGLAHIFRIAPDDLPQELVDQFVDFDNLTAAYTAAATSTDAVPTRIVTSYYQVFLGRLPEGTDAVPGTEDDLSGITFWTQALQAQSDDGVQAEDVRALAETFSVSDEFVQRYGSLSPEGVVREFYLNNLNRDPLSLNPETGELSDLGGYEFWVSVTNQRIDQLIEDGFTPEEARLEAYALLAVDFVFATETQEAVFGPSIDTLLIQSALDASDDGFDADSSIFDVQGSFRPVGEQIGALRYQLTTSSVDGATEVVGNTDTDGDGTPDSFVLSGSPDTTNALRLIGDTDIRIDLTDPREQVEGIDINGDGEISFEEQDQAFRDVVDVSFFEIFDAHPRGDALLNPNLPFTDPDNAAFTGDILFDGTGFGGDGVNTNGNIVLGGYGTDKIFTGIGNDFITTGAGTINDFVNIIGDSFFTGQVPDNFLGDIIPIADEVKAGRNADFIFLELTALDEQFAGQTQLLDAGETFDDDELQDFDWLLLEASDDEEPVEIDFEDAGGILDDGVGGDLDDDNSIEIFDNDLFGGVRTRGSNDDAILVDFENLNASGNFYKFLDIQTETEVTPVDLIGKRVAVGDEAFGTVTREYAALNFIEIPLIGEPELVLRITGTTEAPAGSDVAGQTLNENGNDFNSVLAIVTAVFEAQGGTFIDEDGVEQNAITVRAGSDASGPTIDIVDNNPEGRDFGTAIITGQFEDGTGFGGRQDDILPVSDEFPGSELFDDLFFGDSRDFSIEEEKFRTPNVSPGVTAQILFDGSSATNVVIAGYDNDYIDGESGNDLLFGGDLEFLLTHKNNPNLFSIDGTILLNATDGIVDDGRDTLIGGQGDDNVVWEADAGTYAGAEEGFGEATPGVTSDIVSPGIPTDPSIPSDSSFNSFGYDALWITAFSIGREDDIGLDVTTDGSQDSQPRNFLGVDGVGIEAEQDLTGTDEASRERGAAGEVTTDGVLRFDLGVGRGVEFSGNPEEEFRGGINGANRLNTADQTNYASGFSASIVTGFEAFNATGLGGIDYLAAGTNDPELLFENQQNYRGTNLDIDVRGVDEDVTDSPLFGVISRPDSLTEVDPFAADFSENQLIAGFNLNWNDASDNPLPALVYSTTAANDVFGSGDTNTDVDSAADNTLFTNRGDDVLEGRGGNDWTEAREGDDIFLVSTNDGDNDFVDVPFVPEVYGDDINIIAKRLDADADGLLDEATDAVGRIGRDFRNPAGQIQDNTVFVIDAFGVFNLEPGDGEDGSPLDRYTNLTGIAVETANEGTVVIDLDNTVRFAAELAEVLEDELNDAGFDVETSTSPAIKLNNLAEIIPGEGQDGDAVFLDFSADDGIVQIIPQFIPPTGEINGGYAARSNIAPPVDVVEDDEIVFRSYQDRTDDEGTFDLLASLGKEAYAEDLVIGVEDGTTKLVEGQAYELLFTDLKDGDVVTITINGCDFTAEVGFDLDTNDVEGETTRAFIERFVDEINEKIKSDPHSTTGNLRAEAIDFIGFGDESEPRDNVNTFGIRVYEASLDEDSDSPGLFDEHSVLDAQQTFLQFPEVTIEQGSGGQPAEVVVKEASDTSVVIFDYDYRDTTLSNTGLNRGVDQYAQRGDEQDDRFITFEGKSGLNRSNLQEAVSGQVLEGLDVIVFDDEVTELSDIVEIRPGLEAALDGNNDAYLIQDNSILEAREFFDLTPDGSNPGNGDGRIGDGSTSGDLLENYSGLGGDDLLRGSIGNGNDSIDGRTGDDAILLTGGNDTVDGGLDIVVDLETGLIITENGELVQSDSEIDTDGDGNDDQRRIVFDDRLVAEAEGANGIFAESQFFLNIDGVADDFSLDATFSVDELRDGDIDHVTTASNITLYRTLNKFQDDVLTFSGISADEDGRGIDYINTHGVGAIDLTPGDDDREGEGFAQGFENVTGTAGDDILVGGEQDETLLGGDGNDTIDGGNGDDSLEGQGGHDVVLGGGGDDTLRGLDDNDLLQGGDGDDLVFGGEGDDLISNVDLVGLIGGIIDYVEEIGDLADPDDIEFVNVPAPSVDGGEDTVFAGNGGDTIIQVSDGDPDEINANDNDDVVHFLTFGEGDEDTIDGGSGFDVLNLNTFRTRENADGTLGIDPLEPLTITFFANDELSSDGSGDLELELLVLSIDGKPFETVSLTVDEDDFDADDPFTIADDVAEELNALGFSAFQDGDSVVVNNAGAGTVVFLNSATFGDQTPAASSDMGLIRAVRRDDDGDPILDGTPDDLIFDAIPAIVDGRNTTFTNFEETDLNGAIFVISNQSYDDLDDVLFGGIFGLFADGIMTPTVAAEEIEVPVIGIANGIVLAPTTAQENAGEGVEIENEFDEDNFDASAVGIGSAIAILGSSAGDTLTGGDTLEGDFGATSFHDAIFGGDGDDEISGLAGDDLLDGGEGSDQIDGGNGDDLIFGGLDVYGGPDDIPGSGDFLDGDMDEPDAGSDPDGNDSINGGSGDDEIYGQGGDDVIDGGFGDDEIHGGEGDDVLTGGPGEEPEADDEDDEVPSNNDVIEGGDGNDVITGGYGEDELFGDAGADTIRGGDGDDELSGGEDRDSLQGDDGDDFLEGGVANDTLGGGDGDDELFGGDDDDQLFGNAGEDTLDGEQGDDVLFGGQDADTFVLRLGDGVDDIRDFDADEDTIFLDGLAFGDLDADELAEGNVVAFGEVLATTNVDELTADDFS